LKPTTGEPPNKVRGLDWFLLNLKIGALSFGGAGRILLYQEGVVEKNRWLTEDEYQEIFTVAQVLPGPNLVNLSVYIGYRLTNVLWTVLGLLALALPGLIVALAVLGFVDFQNFHVAALFQGFSIGSIALFCAFLWKIRKGLATAVPLKKLLRLSLIGAIVLAVLLEVPLAWILAAGIPGCLAAEFAT